ncbi:MAG: histidine--tRNA ligase [Phycisphaerales bacterium]
MAQPPGKSQSFQAPTGTRDFYPIELARRRFIEDAWRKVSIRHGFDEIDGPTFEHLDLYTVKSGEGIVSELFSFQRAGGEKTYALRPEFTPTLARLYAANAGSLAKPTKWFWQSTCFRAERPQRGRLREFVQWNVDHLGGESRPDADAEVIACIIDLLATSGLSPQQIRVKIGDRNVAAAMLRTSGVAEDCVDLGLAILDRRAKLPAEVIQKQAGELGLDLTKFDQQAIAAVSGQAGGNGAFADLAALRSRLDSAGLGEWVQFDFNIARGLAYYTGMVFEVLVDGERAIAGGGRYDNLIELFGGPSTPAVGFGFGDVVFSLVLQDKKLMLSDKEIARSLGLRPDAFVISNGTPESDVQLTPILAALRRRGMHARRSYRTTKNIGKLLKEASDADARFAIIIESSAEITLKNLDDGTQDKGPAEMLLARITAH